MKILKGIIFTSALILLAACGPEKEKTNSNQESQPTTVESIEESTSKQQDAQSEEQVETIEIKLVKLDYSSFEQSEYGGAPYTYVNKSYLVKVFAYGDDQEHPLESDQIEYFAAGFDGSTQIDYVKYEQGDKPNEFLITPLPKSLTTGMGRFDLRGRARIKGEKAWVSAYNPLSGVSVIEEPVE